jgi:uncharacterized protein YfaS (alpha-2-macroglobulin family)
MPPISCCARGAAADVSAPALTAALKYIAEPFDEMDDRLENLAEQAYRLYVPARADQGRPGAARVAADCADRLPKPVAKAQRDAALALADDPKRTEAPFAAALANPERKAWHGDYGTATMAQLGAIWPLSHCC